MENIQTRCCIAGGGPAGMMLGFLLARASIDVVVLEKHADFFRDFRGDTIHPSTLQVMHELGILEGFLERPHQKVRRLGGQIGDHSFAMADFSHVPTRCKFIALMPQWDFLNFLAEHARRYPAFKLEMNAEVGELLYDRGKVIGVRATTPGGGLEVRADLVIGSDGRHSTVRDRAGLQVIDVGAPMDVLWMRISRRASDPNQAFGRIGSGQLMAMIDRTDYWQCAYVIPKGKLKEIRRAGLPAFRNDIAALAPFLGNRVEELGDWSEIKLLTVTVDRLRRWYRPGLLCIGDAAHAMSPIGGVGINLAIQDAVAAANVLAARPRRRYFTLAQLRKVQRRREPPTRLTQSLQVFIQNRVITGIFRSTKPLGLPLPLRLLNRWPILRSIPAYAVGIGFRPEHVRTPESQGGRA
ncbi:MAG: FAD-dependent oxidoreductase [Candidatus Eremiobacteraeota bacterium]|nr:FAD-dependent oxidoreductase [Candidatus Eremiobacteraeota bacterium]MBC5826641.1 FAD-dependent oxidoreductase [Candidatus Eremiobacteraeota bacterium]